MKIKRLECKLSERKFCELRMRLRTSGVYVDDRYEFEDRKLGGHNDVVGGSDGEEEGGGIKLDS